MILNIELDGSALITDNETVLVIPEIEMLKFSLEEPKDTDEDKDE